ncbi:TetR/AcrR family transcriptional regulator [Blastochloris viridis]|uniref:Rut operon repressor n=1 Tax=Blastochloris viridis TaxID=1079 RepID=A0A0H5BBH5_BLAVI|nr:TetR/AcrR family transcriptional regulator [Blastochloris viridis]ALK10510.1 HTH-type transcriptional regulator RutR [Blastochloris viridis]BAR99540.1 transcriptional regulator [Blastochloris viridis]CUU43172.1 Rut operon repressor [Blastochloris viridis]
MADDRRPRSNSRNRILDAAAEIVAEIGAGKMTLEAVAERAGLSKGGLLYNFPSKDALLQAMVERMVEDGVAQRNALRPTLTDRPNLEARCIIASDLASCGSHSKDVASGLLAAMSENPRLLDPVREVVAEEWAMLQASDCPDVSNIAWLAVQGLLTLDMFAISPLETEDRNRVIAALHTLLDHRTLPLAPGR